MSNIESNSLRIRGRIYVNINIFYVFYAGKNQIKCVSLIHALGWIRDATIKLGNLF